MREFVSRFWFWYLQVINRRPLVTTALCGIVVYFVALAAAVVAVVVADYGLLYSFTCVVAASLVLAYHWVMSRYQTESVLAQLMHLSGALIFMWLALAMPIRYSLLMD